MTATSAPRSPSAIPAPPGGAPARAAQPWHWHLRQWAATFVPLMLMALLAAGTWWLVNKSMPASDTEGTPRLRHEPDYEMHNFTVQRYHSNGSLKARLEGETLRHYPDTDTLEIDQVRVHAISPDGRVITAVARRAVANGAGTEVELFGGAEVVRLGSGTEEAVQFRSEYLHAFLDEERVVSNQPVTVVQGTSQVRADGMEYNRATGVIRFSGRTRASFGPKPTAATP